MTSIIKGYTSGFPYRLPLLEEVDAWLESDDQAVMQWDEATNMYVDFREFV